MSFHNMLLYGDDRGLAIGIHPPFLSRCLACFLRLQVLEREQPLHRIGFAQKLDLDHVRPFGDLLAFGRL